MSEMATSRHAESLAVRSRDRQFGPQLPSNPRNIPRSRVLLATGAFPNSTSAVRPLISHLCLAIIQRATFNFRTSIHHQYQHQRQRLLATGRIGFIGQQAAIFKIPLILRLTGCWLIWSAWCSASGWLLSLAGQLDVLGYAVLSPVLLGCLWCWLKGSAQKQSLSSQPHKKIFRHLRRPAALVYAVTALLSLLAGALYQPWSIDAVIYRLPRILYWWWAHHWYWIGTPDHRLNYSSTGFEWQMLPVIQLTHSDRFLFLLNWLPFLLMPGLVFSAFRGMGISGTSARRWMWLLPSGYCFALQCSGLQNDGYSANYLLASVAFATVAFRSKRGELVLLSILSAALLTGAKLSNLPLLLPLGLVLWPTLRYVRWFNWKTPLILTVVFLGSFAPLAFLSWKLTGDWTGDPTDQFHLKTHSDFRAVLANTAFLLNDAIQLPCLPGSQHLQKICETINQSSFLLWLQRGHRLAPNFQFGEVANEGGAGAGFGLALYALVLVSGGFFYRPSNERTVALPLVWRLSLFSVWFSFLVFLAKLGSYHTARTGAPYYPLLLISLLHCPRLAAFERKKAMKTLAVCAAATVLPVILLTPARPLVPVQTLARIIHCRGMAKIAAKYRFWDNLRDDLAPLREHLPEGLTRLAYAGGFLDTPYGLCKPLGSRTVIELGLPESGNPMPPDLEYAVVTERGLRERCHLDLNAWLSCTHGKVVFQFPRNCARDCHTTVSYENWYLVKFMTKKDVS